ncbi:MBOAT family O-acyltransferase [Pseudomonas sp. 148P]|uniref:Probable alginate O-acetylase n=1 Tax=Pseudomonas ulcerans TaxID=3115852 RepID=A0ABU7HR31_9PSED|nr:MULTISPECIES: MBOAT family O-acyltransferase [unclassified Pseudomonas]MEE1923017.1 MBOAT family O-acyltransferase [Pseudomonas sp. 147P]MEE1933979.1 MBOAT family O-acyltransferase [Pseudomonas sp. 148P]
MVFASLEFLTLFLPLFMLVYALSPARGRNVVLLLGSWLFYGWLSPLFLLLHVVLTVIAWAGGLLVDRSREDGRGRVRLLAALIVLNTLVLCWYKYANILAATYSELISHYGYLPLEWQRVALPAGLSFIVLQAISYLVDVHRHTVPVERSLVNFATYISMFGHSIAGPIIRYDWVRSELNQRYFDWQNFSLGARRFMIGMCMKVLVADTLSPLVDIAFHLENPSFLDAWLGCLAYSLQLFFDFAGYSAMAIGLGLMLGFHFPENFNRPYLASSIQDFWRRWHLSLSSWLRDYLYIALGGNRFGTWNTYRNLFLTMAIAGLWHGGDSWNYLLWGAAHGVALCIDRAWSRSSLPAIPKALSHSLTLLFVCLAWTLFRAPDFATALAMYGGQFGLHGFALGEALSASVRPVHALAAALGVFCVIAPLYQARVEQRYGHSALYAVLAALWPVAGFLLAFSLIASRDAVPFLYFQF